MAQTPYRPPQKPSPTPVKKVEQTAKTEGQEKPSVPVQNLKPPVSVSVGKELPTVTVVFHPDRFEIKVNDACAGLAPAKVARVWHQVARSIHALRGKKAHERALAERKVGASVSK